MPHDATSLEELETIVAQFGHRERRWDMFNRIAAGCGLAIPPEEMWLLIQLCRQPGARSLTDLAYQFLI